jgi:BirA family transcriptional regulator, biotin operon repressor / biotin---[acetyl-CoA-carboxylase] ligase
VLTIDQLQRALAAAGLEAPVRADEVTGSTNDTAREMAEAGSPEWTLVTASHQTAGRGRLGREWLDRRGSALMFSVVLRPSLPPERAGLVPLLAGVAMARAAREATGADVRCKWPNDLMLGDAKIGGILAESVVGDGRLRFVVVGVGVNLGDPPAGVERAGALPAGQEPLLRAFLGELTALYEPADPGFGDSVLSAYREVSATIGRQVEATTVEGSRVSGTAVDVDDRGDLIVETAEGPRAVAFGEIAHLTR